MAKTSKPKQGTALRYYIIDKYRENIAGRYQYDTLKVKGLPPKITKEVVDSLRDYFLENLYPEATQREKLDAAFSNLESYVKSPAKVFDLLGNLTSAIFKFGFQFPAALKAGLISLEAYTAAISYENLLTQTVETQKLQMPITDEQLLDALTVLPEKEIERFIVDLEKLFFTFTNTELLEKTISIMEEVMERMRSKPNLYDKSEIEAIQLGLSIMQKGYSLFMQYDDEMKELMVNFITENERKFLADIRNRKKKKG